MSRATDEETTTRRATLRAAVSEFQRKYSDPQRDAIASAVLDRQVKQKRAAELAAAGELTAPDGTKIPAFEIPVPTVRTIIDRERKARVGKRPSQLEQLPPRDSTELLRRALVSAIEHKIGRLRKRLDRDESSVTFGELREAARLLRELQALPGPTEERRPAPGQRTNGTQTEGPSRSALAREIMAAAKDSGSTAQDASPTAQTYTDTGDASGNAPNDATQHDDAAQERAPGSLTRGAATSDHAELEHAA